MSKSYKKLFTYLNPPEPPGDLFKKIMHRIHEERRLLIIKRRLVIFSISLIGSIVAFIPAFQTVKTGFIESGFTEYLSLLFSDTGIVVTYWQNFTFSLLETLPIMSLVAFLITMLVFLESLKLLAKNIKNIFIPTQLINT